MSSYGRLQCIIIIYAKVFQCDRILRSTNGFIFQIISSLIESIGECLTWPDCKDLLFCCLFVCFSLGLFYKALCVWSLWKHFCLNSSCYFSRAEHRALENFTSRPDTQYTVKLCLRLRANGRNNSQHCCANNVGSCCVRVGSGVQTDATTPNKFGTCSASWEEYNP